MIISAPMNEEELRNLMFTAQEKNTALLHKVSTWQRVSCQNGKQSLSLSK